MSAFRGRTASGSSASSAGLGADKQLRDLRLELRFEGLELGLHRAAILGGAVPLLALLAPLSPEPRTAVVARPTPRRAPELPPEEGAGEGGSEGDRGLRLLALVLRFFAGDPLFGAREPGAQALETGCIVGPHPRHRLVAGFAREMLEPRAKGTFRFARGRHRAQCRRSPESERAAPVEMIRQGAPPGRIPLRRPRARGERREGGAVRRFRGERGGIRR